MKLVFIHIPKTAGSSLSSLVLTPGVKGLWLMESQLGTVTRDVWERTDMLAGHFTLTALKAYARQNSVDLSKVKIVAVIRDPFDQVYANLNYPFELVRRGDTLHNWMNKMVSGPPDSPEHVISVLSTYPWLLNMQTNYLRNEQPHVDVEAFDLLGVFPDIDLVYPYMAMVLGLEGLREPPHRNSSEKILDKSMFQKGPVRDFLTRRNDMDNKLFARVAQARRRI